MCTYAFPYPSLPGIPIFAPLSPITVPLGGRAELECQVTSNPPATVTWFYELGSVIRSVTTGGRFTISPADVLTIIDVQETDVGYYVCSAQNAFGTNTTAGRLQIGGMENRASADDLTRPRRTSPGAFLEFE